jgi:hypothetical protein
MIRPASGALCPAAGRGRQGQLRGAATLDRQACRQQTRRRPAPPRYRVFPGLEMPNAVHQLGPDGDRRVARPADHSRCRWRPWRGFWIFWSGDDPGVVRRASVDRGRSYRHALRHELTGRCRSLGQRDRPSHNQDGVSAPRPAPARQRLLQLLEQAFLARRMVFTSRSDGELPVTDFCLICAPRRTTMSQKSSLPQLAKSVSMALIPDTNTVHTSDRVLSTDGG